MALSYQDKYFKITEFVTLNYEFQTVELMAELNMAFEVVTSLEPLGVPTYALKSIAHALRFSLDFGGQSTTAKKLDVIAQDLASQGFIREPETLNELEDFLVNLYNQDRNIKNQIKESKDKLDWFYNNFILDNNFKFTKKAFNNVFVLIFKFFFRAVLKLIAFSKVKVIFAYLISYKSLILDLGNNKPPSNKSP